MLTDATWVSRVTSVTYILYGIVNCYAHCQFMLESRHYALQHWLWIWLCTDAVHCNTDCGSVVYRRYTSQHWLWIWLSTGPSGFATPPHSFSNISRACRRRMSLLKGTSSWRAGAFSCWPTCFGRSLARSLGFSPCSSGASHSFGVLWINSKKTQTCSRVCGVSCSHLYNTICCLWMYLPVTVKWNCW